MTSPAEETPKTNKSRAMTIFFALAVAVVTGLAGAIGQRLIDIFYPPKSPTVVVAFDQNSGGNKLGTPSLVKDFPPLAYKMEFSGSTPASQGGLFNLQRTPPVWHYELWVANVSNKMVGVIDVAVKLQAAHGRWGIYSRSVDMRKNNGVVVAKGSPIDALADDSEISFEMQSLDSGRAICIHIFILNELRIPPDKIAVEIRCPDGKFVQISHVQWAAGNWKPTKFSEDFGK